MTAVILAGGRSTRFGSDKGLATWRGRRLVDHVLDRLPAGRDGTVLVIREEQDEGSWPGVSIVHDDPDRNEGPLRGVIRGLAACQTYWAWVVACDQPLVSAELLLALQASALPDDQALLPEWKGRLQPLTGMYAVNSGPLLAERETGGEKSLIGALKTVGYRVFTEEKCRRYDHRGLGFLNINRPDQFAELEGYES
ncbi:MAG: molybdenum cofactor guanylyltransferase [Candidatus Krumholzibacteria bacterium]|nr:molybdenum cofactor guanylyltransferase [Candidatus Krumholzibacteria bacterium]